MLNGRSAVFLDRDGTINREVAYLYRPEKLEWIPGAIEAIRKLNEAGLLVLVVTNQAGVARGFFGEDDVERLHRFMNEKLFKSGARIDGFYYCPFHPDGVVAQYRRTSDCRKPATGMIDRALSDWNVDPARSFLIGDKNSDIDAGNTAGVSTWLVETGYGKTEKVTTKADHTAVSIKEAVDEILEIWTTIR